MAADLIAELRQYFTTGATRALTWRRGQLAALQQMLVKHRSDWAQALERDLGKSSFESWITELSQVVAEIEYLRKNLSRWMKPTRARTPLALFPARSSIRHEPLGVTTIIAPWNYPLQLMLSPLAGAIAGGNCAVIKPSEISTAVESLTAKLVPQYLDQSAIRVVTGGPDASNALIDAKPDHVFFTGSTPVGSLIAQRCAKQLIPYTLELGGKSPVYVHDDVNLTAAARRIVWGKYLNSGQTCVAPDHVFVHQSVADKFAKKIAQEITTQFGKNPQESPDFGRMINAKHFERVSEMAQHSPVYCGGEADAEERYIQPTVIYPADQHHPAMQEEIFGPVLPIIPVSGVEDATARIRAADKPLALYIFTENPKIKEEVLNDTFSGGVSINATVIHLSTPYLPFGGVGESGDGNYHGRWSFDTFTHERSVVDKPLKPDTLKLITSPAPGWAKTVTKKFLLPATDAPSRDIRWAQAVVQAGKVFRAR